MRLNYNITEDIYAEVIEYQMKLHNNQRSQVMKYWISNLLFLGLAVYFLVARTEYSWWLRLLPMGMAAILFAMTTFKRVNLPKRARAALKRYLKSGTLAEGFIGQHKLIVEDSMIRRNYGGEWTEISCDDVGGYQQLKDSLLLIAKGVIFEVIPLEVLNENNSRGELIKAIQRGNSESTLTEQKELEELIPENTEMTVEWQADESMYIQGMVEGHRLYFSTRQAWKGSQMVRMIIFLYGVVVLCLRMNLYIGLAFVLIGLMLNRQLLVTFSPLSYTVVRRQVSRLKGNKEGLGYERFYLTGSELIAVFMGQVQRTGIEDISCSRHNGEFTFVYSKTGKMFVIPHIAFRSNGEKDRFYSILNKFTGE